MLIDLLHSSYFSLFLIVALGFMLGRIKIKGLSLDVSAFICASRFTWNMRRVFMTKKIMTIFFHSFLMW